MQAVKRRQTRAVEVLGETAHYGCQAATGMVHGTCEHPPEILSNILQKEPDKSLVLLESWGLIVS